MHTQRQLQPCAHHDALQPLLQEDAGRPDQDTDDKQAKRLRAAGDQPGQWREADKRPARLQRMHRRTSVAAAGDDATKEVKPAGQMQAGPGQQAASPFGVLTEGRASLTASPPEKDCCAGDMEPESKARAAPSATPHSAQKRERRMLTTKPKKRPSSVDATAPHTGEPPQNGPSGLRFRRLSKKRQTENAKAAPSGSVGSAAADCHPALQPETVVEEALPRQLATRSGGSVTALVGRGSHAQEGCAKRL